MTRLKQNRATRDLSGDADCLVVMYHYVRPAAQPGEVPLNALSLESFESQIERIGRSRQFTTLERYLETLDRGSTLPRPAALLTFDDGLADHAEHVFPILRRRSIQGTFFVQTDCVENGAMEPAHVNHLLCGKLGIEKLVAEFSAVFAKHSPRNDWRRYCDSARAARLYHYETESAALFKDAVAFGLPFDLRDRVFLELFDTHFGDPREYARRFYATWEQLAEMQTAGMHVGGHGHRHNAYPRLCSSEAKEDARECARLLSLRLGRQPRAFSYPYGRYDSNGISAVRSGGFVAAMTTESRVNVGSPDPYEIARVDCIHLDPHLPATVPESAHART